MPFARIGADGTFTVLEIKEKSFAEQFTEGFTGILENNKIKFQNGIEIYFENSEYSLENFFPIVIDFDYLTISLGLVETKINVTSIELTQIQEEYYLNGILSSHDLQALLPIIFKNRVQTIYLSYQVPSETSGYHNLITHTVSGTEPTPAPTQTYATTPKPSTPIFLVTELVSNSISIGTSRTECNNLIESSEQIPDYYAWINHIKIGDPTQPTQPDHILFSKEFLDSNNYDSGTTVSLYDSLNNSISFTRQGDSFNNIVLNISNLDSSSNFYINSIVFPHKESHVQQFYLYGPNSPISVLAPDMTLPSLLYTYKTTKNDKDVYEISGTDMAVLEAAWVLRPIYLSIVSGANILCSQFVESAHDGSIDPSPVVEIDVSNLGRGQHSLLDYPAGITISLTVPSRYTINILNYSTSEIIQVEWTSSQTCTFSMPQEGVFIIVTLKPSGGGGSSSGSTFYSLTKDSSLDNIPGTVTISSKNAQPGETVTITIELDEGYIDIPGTISFADSRGVKIPYIEDVAGNIITIEFKMPKSNVIISYK